MAETTTGTTGLTFQTDGSGKAADDSSSSGKSIWETILPNLGSILGGGAQVVNAVNGKPNQQVTYTNPNNNVTSNNSTMIMVIVAVIALILIVVLARR